MENYIINPMAFYWINSLNAVKTVCIATSIICACAGLAFLIGWLYNWCMSIEYHSDDNKTYAKFCKKWVISLCIISLILAMFAIFIPSRDTSIEMMIARTATFSNVEWTVDQVKEIVDYIVKALRGI